MTFVFHFSNVSGVTINVVGHHLTATVGQNNKVLPLGVVSVALLVVTEVDVGVVVLDGVVEVVVSWSL